MGLWAAITHLWLKATDATIQVRLGYWLCKKNYCKSKQLIMWLLFSVCYLNNISWFNKIYI